MMLYQKYSRSINLKILSPVPDYSWSQIIIHNYRTSWPITTMRKNWHTASELIFKSLFGEFRLTKYHNVVILDQLKSNAFYRKRPVLPHYNHSDFTISVFQ